MASIELSRAQWLSEISAGTPFGGQSTIEKNSYNLIGGVPSASILPFEQLRESAQRLLDPSAVASETLAYSRAEGNEVLRNWAAEKEQTSPDDVIIVNGALHGLSLIAQATISPGDIVIAEEPTFPPALQVFQLERAQIHSWALGPDGSDILFLKDILQSGLRPRLVYVIPDFQNPTGFIMGHEARAELLRLAEKFGFFVVWDNPYRDTTFDGQLESDPSGDHPQIIKIGTFSKSFGPGVRLGWMTVPRPLRDSVIALRRRSDQHPSSLMQAVVADMVTKPLLFEQFIAGLRQEHQRLASVLCDGLQRHCEAKLTFVHPRGGYFLWVTVADEEVNTIKLHASARDARLHYVDGTSFGFTTSQRFARNIRFGFTGTTEVNLMEAARILGGLLDEARTV